MSYITDREFYLRVVQGLETGYSVVHKFGEGNVSTTYVPVTTSLVYQTPTTLTSLEFVSSSVDDDSAGTGAREVTVVGIGTGWTEVTQTVVTDGTTPVALATQLYRVYRWYVSASGTYATTAAGSHAGTMTLRVAGAGATWDTIGVTPYAHGQSQIGWYTVPISKKAYLMEKKIYIDTTKSVDVALYKRDNANDVATPYSGAMRIVEDETGVSGAVYIPFAIPAYLGQGPMDVGFMAKVSASTANIAVEFSLLLVDV